MCTDSSIRFFIIDLQGNEEMSVGNGVSRDVYISFWNEAANSLLTGKLNEFHMCEITFSRLSGRPLEKFYPKVTLIQDIFRLF